MRTPTPTAPARTSARAASSGPTTARSPSIFLRFRVRNLGARLATAHLRLQVGTNGHADSNSGGRVHVAACTWDEATVTARSKPAFAAAILASAGGVTQSQLVDFDVSTARIDHDGTYCFAIDTASDDNVDYVSAEGFGLPPALVLTVTP